MKKKTYLKMVVWILILLFFVGCKSSSKKRTTSEKTESAPEKSETSYSSSSSSSSSDEMTHSTYCMLYMQISNVQVTHKRNYTYCTGTITNTGTYSIKFVKVKATLKDSRGNTIDTDWTYAVDSTWLDPGESKNFEMMIKDEDNKIKSAVVTVVLD